MNAPKNGAGGGEVLIQITFIYTQRRSFRKITKQEFSFVIVLKIYIHHVSFI